MDSTERLGHGTTHYCPFVTPYLDWVWTEVLWFAQRCIQIGIQRLGSPSATMAGSYSPLGHWRWPQAQNASQPITTLDSPSRDFGCLIDNCERGWFYGSGKNIDNRVHIYWTTWPIEPELQWQVRLIQKLHSNWNSTYVGPKWRRKQWIPVDGSCHLNDDNDQVARPANWRPTNTGPCSSQDWHNL